MWICQVHLEDRNVYWCKMTFQAWRWIVHDPTLRLLTRVDLFF